MSDEIFSVVADPGGDSVTIDIGGASQHRINAQQLDSLIERLGVARANIVPPVADSAPDPDGAESDVEWFVPGYVLTEGRVFALRSSKFGWMYFTMPEESAADFVDWLQRDLPINDGAPES